MVKSRFLVCKHLVQACHPIHTDFFNTTPARNRTVPFYEHPLIAPLAGPKPPNPDEIESARDEDQDTPADVAREDLDDLDNADDIELDTGLAPTSLPFNTAFKAISESLTFAMAALHSNQAFEDPRFTSNILKHGAGFFKLVDQLRSLQRQTDSHTAPNPNTWGPSGSASLFYRTMPPEVACEALRNSASALRRVANQLEQQARTEELLH
jgi:hypothetical protein